MVPDQSGDSARQIRLVVRIWRFFLSDSALLALGTLLALTVGAATIGIVGRGFGRIAGLLLVGAYAAYAAITLSWQP